MEQIDNRYYIGFEGEPEIRIICKKDTDSESFAMWEGYFDQIMRGIKPENQKWTGLAYCYHMYSGWYDENPWEVRDISSALAQLKSINTQSFWRESVEVLKILCDMLEGAVREQKNVYILKA